ncbi:MAG: hypothetical protein O2945_23380 [Planctomycetota bacterium]|nr:hypothetical protein [Planctomycetota bacterium]
MDRIRRTPGNNSVSHTRRPTRKSHDVAAEFTFGILVLIAEVDWLVQEAVCNSQRLRISPVVIGLTVVAFGTIVLELAVTMQSARRGSSDIAMGNIIDSDIQNLPLVLGVWALFIFTARTATHCPR